MNLRALCGTIIVGAETVRRDGKGVTEKWAAMYDRNDPRCLIR